MKPKLLLRLSAFFMLLHTIGHCIGAFTWKEAPNAAVGKVISGMQTEHFDFMGRSVSLGSFFDGYGVVMIFVLLLMMVLLWLLASDTGNPLTKKLLTPLIIFLLLMAVAEFVYFFPFAAVITSLSAICALAARLGLKRSA